MSLLSATVGPLPVPMVATMPVPTYPSLLACNEICLDVQVCVHARMFTVTCLCANLWLLASVCLCVHEIESAYMRANARTSVCVAYARTCMHVSLLC